MPREAVTWSEVCSARDQRLREMENGHVKDSRTLYRIDSETALMKGG